ncbi:hypothetical protein SBA3_880009 [Candidatus Sulfopaludibacter sp. SbA3]|nr:hypothetical protein SBA3_880009 [Candidatus Sulfopaludibacter sp. SbA3]
MGENWGGTRSFLSEGAGKYAEAMATIRLKTTGRQPPICEPANPFRWKRWAAFGSAPTPEPP